MTTTTMTTQNTNINTSTITALNAIHALTALNMINTINSSVNNNTETTIIDWSSTTDTIMYPIKNNRKLIANTTPNYATRRSKKAENVTNVTYKPNLKDVTIRFSTLSPRTLRY